MKKLLFFFALLFMGAITAFAQVPVNEQLTYQTVVRNAQNQLVFSQNNVSVTVEVCNLDGTTVQYRETHTGLSTNANGLLTLMVGSGTLVSGAWTDIDWSAAAIRTTVTYNPGDGTVSIPSGLAPISAVPYALQAGNANATETDPVFTAWDKSYNDLTNKPTIPDAQVNADWNQDDDMKVDFIKNKPDLTVYATQSGNNTFAGDNSFTGTNTVPSGYDIHTTNGTNCNSVVVNACDLFAVFDSLNRRINSVCDSLQRLNDELTALKNSVPPTATAPSFQNVGSNSMTIKANNTSTGAPITSYKYCYSTNADMSGATCQTTSNPTLNVTGLTPNTTYYATVEATNLAGSTTSETANVRTPAHAPEAHVTEALTSAKPAGFKVEVTDIDPKEKDDATTVQVYYKQSASCNVQENYDDYICATAQDVASDITTNTQTITGLEPSTAYCAIVKVSNGDSTTIYGPYTVTTGEDVTLTVTRDPSTATVSLCGNPTAAVTFTATPSSGDAGDYTYSWSGTPTSTSGNTATYSYASGTHTVTVTATHTTEGYTLTATASTTVNSGGTAVSIGFCESEGIVSVKGEPQGSPNHLEWGDGQSFDDPVSESIEPHDYTALGTGSHSVTITASNASGCTFSRTMTVNVLASGSTAADRTVKPCYVDTHHPAQTGNEYKNNGYGGTVNYGLETVVNDSITSVTDYDGNEYPVVQIGSQCWMAENLRVSHSPKTGSNIVVTAVNSYGSKMAAWYQDNQSTYEDKRYGLLYNWCAAMDTANPGNSVTGGAGTYVEVADGSNNNNYFNFTPSGNHQGVCPKGWHVPTDAEWSTMVAAAGADEGGSSGTGNAKLTTGCEWNSSGVEQDETTTKPGNYSYTKRNESGFSAVPAGYFYGSFSNAGYYAIFWSAAQSSDYYARRRYLYYYYAGVSRSNANKNYGFSVRCVRD